MTYKKLIIAVRNESAHILPYTAQPIDAITINVSREFYVEMHPKYLSQHAIIYSSIKSLRAPNTHIRTQAQSTIELWRRVHRYNLHRNVLFVEPFRSGSILTTVNHNDCIYYNFTRFIARFWLQDLKASIHKSRFHFLY